MAFNTYITLDGKYYKTLQKNWRELPIVPSTARLLLSGDLDVTYGPTDLMIWEGEIAADVSPASGYGSDTDLYTTLRKTTTVDFTDHRGTTYSDIHIEATNARSLLPDWDNVNNTIYVAVKITGKAG